MLFTGCKPKSVILTDHKLSFVIEKDYLLLPIEDTATVSYMKVLVNGEAIAPDISVRLARKNVDYWVPLSVADYKGQKIELLFNQLGREDVGYRQIDQVDEFIPLQNEKFRPLYHFAPPYGWMNDPNGMVYHNGYYHLYYQYNPYGTRWGNMHWGHAMSKDLMTWEHLPVALSPDSLGQIFSGSAIIDKENTAGFGKDALIAIYTSAGKESTQSIAYSLDNGVTFTKYEGNPVLSDPNYKDFRDPKVSWHDESGQWVMVLATGHTISFYGSKDLKSWERLCEFGEGIGCHDGVWECPDLFPLPYDGKTKWVLLVSLSPGNPNGGSATQYFIGDFDGKTFTPDKLPYPLWVDYGRDNYAGVTWSNVSDDRRIFIGWMSNWNCANHVPTTYFRSAMTVPRELSLCHNGKHPVLASVPVKELEAIRGEAKSIPEISVDGKYVIDKLLENNEGAYEIEMTIVSGNAKQFGFDLVNGKGEKVTFLFEFEKELLTIDRSTSGIVDFSNFAQFQIKSPISKGSSYKIRLLVDKASTELFVNDGETVQTNLVFPEEPYNTIEFNAEGTPVQVKDMRVYEVKLWEIVTCEGERR